MHREKPITIYRITVEGTLHERWTDWFNEMRITHDNANPITAVTYLEGPVADQSVLRGLLTKLWDLNLTLISLYRVDTEYSKEANHG